MASAAEQLAANLNWGSIGKATELKKRLWFTVGALVIFRIGAYVPVPGVDPHALAEVFNHLGLVAAFKYEKWRTEWSDGQGHCVIDETPIGNYAELEGAPEWIDRVASTLGVPHSVYMTLSYGRLFEQWRDENQSPAEHLTFEAVLPSGSLT